MIRTENYINPYDGRDFTRTWSDSGRYVVRDGISYEEACDPTEFGYTYTEGEPMVNNTEITAEEALSIITGGEI